MIYEALSPFSRMSRNTLSRKGKKPHQAGRRQRSPRLAMQQQLEDRAMLAGDAMVRFEYLDAAQNVVDSLIVDQSYTLRAYVQDIRETPQGVFSAYLDFDYNPSLINVSGPITHGAEMNSSPRGNTDTPGVLDEVGGIDTDQFHGKPPSNSPTDEMFWFSVPFTANTTGSLTFSANQSENTPLPVLLFNTASAVQISNIMFVGTSVQVNPVATPEVSIAPTNDGNETGPANGLFTVTQSIATGTDTVIGYTVTGTAAQGSDYASVSGTVTIPANQTTATIPISVINDSLIEADETVIVTLDSTITSGDPSVGVSSTNGSAMLSILDNGSGTVSIAATTQADETGPADGVFTVTLSGESSTETVISYTVGGSATTGADFTALSGTVTIPAGSTTATITVPVIDDSTVESLEDVIVTLGSLVSGDVQITVAGAPNNGAALNIADNDSALVSIVPTRNGEEEGPLSGQFTVTLSSPSSTATEVAYTMSGSAASGTDYTAPSGTVTIPAGNLTAMIDLSVMDDNLDEELETISIQLDSISSGNDAVTIDPNPSNTLASIDLLDNEMPTVRIDPTLNGNESGPADGQFTVTLSAPSTTATEVSYTVSGTAISGTDFTALSGTVSIPAGDTTATIAVPVLTDAEVEGDESVIVTLGTLTAGSDDITVDSAADSATISIIDDSIATVSVAATTPGDEEGPVDGVFTVTQSMVSNEDTVIAYTLSGAALEGDDYTTASGTVTIVAGETSATITLGVTDDSTVEGSEDVIVTLESITSGSPSVTIDSLSNVATLSIADNDTAQITLSSAVDPTEEGNGSFTISLDQISSTDTIVSYTLGGTAVEGEDYQSLSGTATIPAGQLSTDVTLTTLDDDEVEGTESIVVTLDSITGDDDITLGTPATLTLDLADDNDSALVSIVAGDNADEEGPANGTFTVTQSAASSTDTVVSYTVTGTATDGTDYTLLSGTVTILAGETTATISIEPIDDSDIEGTETVVLTLDQIEPANPQITIDSANATAAIDLLDNEDALVRIAAGDDGDEAGPSPGTFTVTQDIATGVDTVISYTISGGTATEGDDFTALSGTVTILAGENSATITIDVIDDMLVEGTETLELTLGSITSGSDDLAIDTSSNLATILLADDDTATVSIAGTTDGAEAGPTDGQFTLTLSQASAFDTIVSYTLAGQATSGEDYSVLSSTFTIPAGNTTVVIDLGVQDDQVVEGDETVIIMLANVANVSGGVSIDSGADTGTISIVDDGDTATVSIAATLDGSEEPLENGQFTVTQSAVSSTATVISYLITGSATSGTDYEALSGTVTIPAGSTSATIALDVIDDSDVEGLETVILTLDMITSGDPDISIDSAAAMAQVRISDNESPLVRVSAVSVGDEEGPVGGSFTISQTVVTATDTTVTYTISGTATEGDDYTAITRTAVIPAGELSVQVAIGVIDDNLVEELETVLLTIDSISGDPSLEIDEVQQSRQLSILDNDTALLGVTATADGDETGPANGQFTFTLSQPSATDTTVGFTIDGTATADEDFTAFASSVTIPAGETSVTIEVLVADDQLVEGDETLIITLDSITSGLTAIGLDDAALSATVTIADDDEALVSIATTTDGDETGPADGQFTVTQTMASEQDTVIAYAVTGTATDGSDYVALSGTVTILAGETTATIPVSVLDDLLVEGTESVIVTLTELTSASGSVTLDTTALEATVEIADDDMGLISIAATANADEGTLASGQFTVTLTNPSETDTVVSYTVAGTATSDEDYAELSGTVTILAGETTAVIDVLIIDDALIEGEETVIVTLDGISSGNTAISIDTTAAEATVTIADDEVSNATVSIAALVDGEETGDDDMPTNGQFIVLLTSASATDTVISYTVTGTATPGADYTALSGTVTIPAGDTSATIDVPALDDSQVEEDETVIVTLDAITEGNPAITIDTLFGSDVVNILDDADAATVSIEPTTNGDEAGPTDGSFTVTLSQASDTDTVVNYTVSGTATAGDDFTALSGTVTIPAGETSATITIAVIDDELVEATEQVTLTLDNIDPGDADITIDTAAASASVSIASDDEALVSIAATTAGDEEGPVDGVFTVSLSQASETDTVIAYTVSGTATAGSDYTALSGTVTILAGETTATITVPVTDDTLMEELETVVVALDAISSGAEQISLDTDADEATVEIADNDDGLISIAATTAGDEEGPVDGVFTVTQNGITDTDTVISYTVSGTAASGSDFTALSGTVTIPAGSTSATITVPVLDDTLIEVDETVIVALDEISSGDASLALDTAADEATVNIASDDTGVVSIAAGTNGNETGPVNGTFTITLDGTAEVDVVVNYTVTGTATSGSDFTALSGTATIPAGQSSVTVTVPVLDDTVVEDDETVTLTLDSVTAGTLPVSISTTDDEATITIVSENDAGMVSIAPGTNGNEAGPVDGTFTVTLSQASATATTISYTVGGTATSSNDFAALSGTVTIPAGQTSAVITVDVTNDINVEGTETVVITLQDVTAGASEIILDSANSSASINILDNEVSTNPSDTNTATVAFAQAASTAVEANGTATVNVVLSIPSGGVLERAVTVNITVAGGTATSGTDFTLTTMTVTFAAGSQNGATRPVTLSVVNDTVAEGSETVNLSLAVPGSSAIVLPVATPSSHVLTITDEANNGTISGSVYVDGDKDGSRDATEIGVPGITVVLTSTGTGGQTINLTAMTDNSGNYSFTNLPAGTYTITQTHSTALHDFDNSLGTVDGTASGTISGNTFTGITLGTGDTAEGYGFGEAGLQTPFANIRYLRAGSNYTQLFRESVARAAELDGNAAGATAIRNASVPSVVSSGLSTSSASAGEGEGEGAGDAVSDIRTPTIPGMFAPPPVQLVQNSGDLGDVNGDIVAGRSKHVLAPASKPLVVESEPAPSVVASPLVVGPMRPAATMLFAEGEVASPAGSSESGTKDEQPALATGSTVEATPGDQLAALLASQVGSTSEESLTDSVFSGDESWLDESNELDLDF